MAHDSWRHKSSIYKRSLEVARELTSVGIKVVIVLDIPIPPSYGGRPTLLNSDTTSPYVLKHSQINERLVSYF